MNSSQIKYAKQRAEQIKNRRERQIIEKYFNKRKLLSDAEKVKALKAGRFSISANFYRWYEAVKFTDEILVNTEAQSKETLQLHKEFETLIDELVLGDCNKALALLKKFEGDI